MGIASGDWYGIWHRLQITNTQTSNSSFCCQIFLYVKPYTLIKHFT